VPGIVINLSHAVQSNGSNSMMVFTIALFLASALTSLIGACTHNKCDGAFEAEKLGFRS
jgi:uncharacterized membrane protein